MTIFGLKKNDLICFFTKFLFNRVLGRKIKKLIYFEGGRVGYCLCLKLEDLFDKVLSKEVKGRL